MNNGEHEHRVAYCGDDDLTDEQPFTFVEVEKTGTMWFVIREHHTAADLEKAWQGYRCIAS